MKKVRHFALIIVCAVALMFALVGCGDSGSSKGEKVTEDQWMAACDTDSFTNVKITHNMKYSINNHIKETKDILWVIDDHSQKVEVKETDDNGTSYYGTCKVESGSSFDFYEYQDKTGEKSWAECSNFNAHLADDAGELIGMVEDSKEEMKYNAETGSYSYSENIQGEGSRSISAVFRNERLSSIKYTETSDSGTAKISHTVKLSYGGQKVTSPIGGSDTPAITPTGARVTKSQWRKALDIPNASDNLKMTMASRVVESDGSHNEEYDTEFVYVVWGANESIQIDDNVEKTNMEFREIFDNGYTTYSKSSTSGWDVGVGNVGEVNNRYHTCAEYLDLGIELYDSFSYDASSKSYKGDMQKLIDYAIVELVDGSIENYDFTLRSGNAELKFNSKGLLIEYELKVDMSINMPYGKFDVVINEHAQLVYGGQTVTAPEVGGGGSTSDGRLSISQWQAAFDLDKYSKNSALSMISQSDKTGETRDEFFDFIFADGNKAAIIKDYDSGLEVREIYDNGKVTEYRCDPGVCQWSVSDGVGFVDSAFENIFGNLMKMCSELYHYALYDNHSKTYSIETPAFMDYMDKSGHLQTEADFEIVDCNLTFSFDSNGNFVSYRMQETGLKTDENGKSRQVFILQTIRITYGGQTVTAPELNDDNPVDPVDPNPPVVKPEKPITETQWREAFDYETGLFSANAKAIVHFQQENNGSFFASTAHYIFADGNRYENLFGDDYEIEYCDIVKDGSVISYYKSNGTWWETEKPNEICDNFVSFFGLTMDMLAELYDYFEYVDPDNYVITAVDLAKIMLDLGMSPPYKPEDIVDGRVILEFDSDGRLHTYYFSETVNIEGENGQVQVIRMSRSAEIIYGGQTVPDPSI